MKGRARKVDHDELDEEEAGEVSESLQGVGRQNNCELATVARNSDENNCWWYDTIQVLMEMEWEWIEERANIGEYW